MLLQEIREWFEANTAREPLWGGLTREEYIAEFMKDIDGVWIAWRTCKLCGLQFEWLGGCGTPTGNCKHPGWSGSGDLVTWKYPNGSKRWARRYKDGQVVAYLFYRRDGSLTQVSEYKDGTRIGCKYYNRQSEEISGAGDG